MAFGQPIFRGENFRANLHVVERLRAEVAAPRGVPLSQIALAWVLGHPAISTARINRINFIKMAPYTRSCWD